MGYNFGELILAKRTSPAALEVLLGMEGLIAADKFSVYGFCETLVDDLKSQPMEDMENGDGARMTVEQVVIGAPDPGSTATLDDVSVDLT
jgi:hypothetical protein